MTTGTRERLTYSELVWSYFLTMNPYDHYINMSTYSSLPWFYKALWAGFLAWKQQQQQQQQQQHIVKLNI